VCSSDLPKTPKPQIALKVRYINNHLLPAAL